MSKNNLNKLNVINKEKLSGLYCSHNSLKKLKISKSMKKLFALDCSYNKITKLNIKGVRLLENIDCSHNRHRYWKFV